MELTREEDIDPAALAGKRVAVIGFGNQGRAQALNLKDSGVDVVVGLRGSSVSRAVAQELGLKVADLNQAVAAANIVMLLTPDEVQARLYRDIEPDLRRGAALGFSHGLAVHFRQIEPREDLDIFLVAPKGPGTALRSLYQAGSGMVALWAVAQDATGGAKAIALAYGHALGCARAGLIASTFAEECEADLFNEHAVVWGAVPEILIAGFETLVEAGVAPEVAYLECVGELKLLAELIEARGIAGMREVISNTAEFGALRGGRGIVNDGVRERMKAILGDIRSGRFARELGAEADGGYKTLERSRAEARAHPAEQALRRLRALHRKA